MDANIEIVFRDFLKNNFLDLRGLWFGRHCSLNYTDEEWKTLSSIPKDQNTCL